MVIKYLRGWSDAQDPPAEKLGTAETQVCGAQKDEVISDLMCHFFLPLLEAARDLLGNGNMQMLAWCYGIPVIVRDQMHSKWEKPEDLLSSLKLVPVLLY